MRLPKFSKGPKRPDYQTKTSVRLVTTKPYLTMESKRWGETKAISSARIPINTIKSNKCIWKQFSEFCKKRNYVLTKELSVSQLNDILKDWGLNMRKLNGDDYKESVVKTIWNVTAKQLQERYFNKYGIQINPFHDIGFKEARDARNSKRRQLQARPDKRTFRSPALTKEEKRQLINQWDEDTPVGLQRKFYHIVASELGWRGVDAANAKVHYFKVETDPRGNPTGRIGYNPSFDNAEEKVQSKWLCQNVDNPGVCPVRLFQKLVARRPAHVTTERIFLTPNPYWNLDYATGEWYKNIPIGTNNLSKWKRQAAEKVGVYPVAGKTSDVGILPNASVKSDSTQSFVPIRPNIQILQPTYIVAKNTRTRASNHSEKTTIPVQDMSGTMCFIAVPVHNPSVRETPKNEARNASATYYSLPEANTDINNKPNLTNGIHKSQEQVVPKTLKPPLSVASKSLLPNFRPAHTTPEEFSVTDEDLISRCNRLLRDKKLLVRKLKSARQEVHSLRLRQYKDLLIRRRIGDALKKVFTISQRQKVLYGKRVQEWDEQTINNAIVLKQYSKRAYLYLKNCLHYPLPAIKTLQNLQNLSRDGADT